MHSKNGNQTPADSTPGGDPPRYQAGVVELASGVTGWMQPNGAWGESNAGLISGHGESLLVDTLWDAPRTGRMLEELAPRLAGAPIGPIVNTHSDGDHWWGNRCVPAREIIATDRAAEVMRREGPELMRRLQLATRACRALGRWAPGTERRKRYGIIADYFTGMTQPFSFGNPRPTRPSRTFSGTLRMQTGGREVELIEVGPAHTAGDLVVLVPDARILFAGDIVFLGSTPVLWQGPLKNWLTALERILDLEIDRIVPGHGPLTGRDGIEQVRGYWLWMDGEARRHYQGGASADEAARQIAASDGFRAGPYVDWDCPERLVINVHTLYREYSGRSGELNVVERLRIMSRMAAMAREFPHAAPRRLHA